MFSGKIALRIFLTLAITLSAFGMEQNISQIDQSKEKTILIIDPNDDVRSLFSATILKNLKEHLNAKHKNASIDDCLVRCATPKEARNRFPNADLYIITLGAGEGPMDYANPNQSPSTIYHQEMNALENEMNKNGLKLAHKRLQVVMDKSTLASDNKNAFIQAARSLANPMNPEYKKFEEISKKLISNYENKAK